MVNEKALIVLPSRGTALDRDDRSVNQLNAICLYSLLIKKPLFIFLWSFSFLRITFFFCILQHLYAQYYENPTDCTKQETQWAHLNDQARNPQPDNGDSEMSSVPHQTSNSSAMSLTGSCHIKWWLSLDTIDLQISLICFQLSSLAWRRKVLEEGLFKLLWTTLIYKASYLQLGFIKMQTVAVLSFLRVHPQRNKI